MTNDNLISALRNMVDDIENLGAAPQTVDINLLKQAIAALTPPEGYVLVPVEPTEPMIAAFNGKDSLPYPEPNRIAYKARHCYSAMLAARPEISP